MKGERDDFDWRDPPDDGGLEIHCRRCGHRFAVPHSLKGGLTNCPECRTATEVPGGPEPLFWVLLSGGILLGLIFTAVFAVALGAAAGVITFAVCALILVALVLAS